MSGFDVPSYAYKYFPLRLFNIGQPGGGYTNADIQGLNSTSSFFTPFSALSGFYATFPEYPVNTSPTIDRTQDNFYFSSNIDGTLTQSLVSSATEFDTPLSFNFDTITSGISSTTTPTTTPDSPTAWSDYLGTLQYSDRQQATLVAQPTFKIPNVGLGLLATTDGAGNVTNVQIDMSYQGLTWRGMDVLNPLYNFVDREAILLRDTLNIPAGNIAQDNNLRVGKAQDSQSPGVSSLIPSLSTSPAGLGLGLTNGISGLNGINNPVLNRLSSLQLKDPSLLIAGFNTQFSPESSRLFANNQAKLDIDTTASFKNNLQQLTQGYITSQPQTSPRVSLADQLTQMMQVQQTRQMDGKIPLVAVLPGNNAQPSSTYASLSADLRPSMGVEDALSKKSAAANPFLWFGPSLLLSQKEQLAGFQQQQATQYFQDTGSQSGSFGGSSQQGYGRQNPFSGSFGGFNGGAFGGNNQEQQNFYRPRQPISYVA